jgi:hypothetical protein
MPPGGVFATVDLVPVAPIQMASGVVVLDGDGIPAIDYTVAEGNYAHLYNGTAAIFPLFIRIKITRTRSCDFEHPWTTMWTAGMSAWDTEGNSTWTSLRAAFGAFVAAWNERSEIRPYVDIDFDMTRKK